MKTLSLQIDDSLHEALVALLKQFPENKVKIYESTVEPPLTESPRPIKMGLFRGQITMSDDFDDYLGDDFWLGSKS